MAASTLTPAFVPVSWVAERLGLHPDTFRRRRPILAKAGFPEPDPVMGRYLVDDVEAWLRKRRRVAPPGDPTGNDTQEVKLDAL